MRVSAALGSDNLSCLSGARLYKNTCAFKVSLFVVWNYGRKMASWARVGAITRVKVLAFESIKAEWWKWWKWSPQPQVVHTSVQIQGPHAFPGRECQRPHHGIGTVSYTGTCCRKESSSHFHWQAALKCHTCNHKYTLTYNNLEANSGLWNNTALCHHKPCYSSPQNYVVLMAVVV